MNGQTGDLCEVPKACAICGGSLERQLLSHATPDQFEKHVGISDANYQRFWYECSGCGGAHNILLKQSRERLDDFASEYYEVNFPDTPAAERYANIMTLPTGQSDNAGRVNRIRTTVTALGLRNRYVTANIKRPRCIDIGAGLGVFAMRFRSEEQSNGQMWDVTALEPDQHSIRHLHTLDGLTVKVEKLDSNSQFGQYQLVTLNKVIEHTTNPHEIVGNAARLVDLNNGILYVEVPDVLTIRHRPESNFILGSLHNHLYTPRALEIVFERSGLVPLKLERLVEPSGKLSVFGFAVTQQLFQRWASD